MAVAFNGRRRIMKRLVIAFLAIIISIALVYLWLVKTTSGLDFALQQTRLFLPDTFSYHSIEGTLSEGITIQQLEFKSPDVTVSVDDAKIKINLFQLITAKLDVESIAANSVHATINTTTPVVTDSLSPVVTTQTRENAKQSLALPISITINDSSITSVLITYSQDQSLQFDQVRINNLEIDRAIEAGLIEFQWNGNHFSVKGILPTSEYSALNISLAHNSTLNEIARPIIGEIHAEGSLADMTVNGSLSSPDIVSYKGAVNSILEKPSWEIQLSTPIMHSGNWSSASTGQVLDVTLRTKGNLDNFDVQSTGKVESFDFQHSGQTWAYDAALNKTSGKWIVDHLDVSDTHSRQRVTFKGSADTDYQFNEQTPLDLHAQWTDLQYPDTNSSYLSSLQGQADIHGTFNQYNVDAKLDLTAGDHQITNIELNGSGTPTNLKASNLKGSYLDGDWQGTALIDWKDGWIWRANLDAKNVNLGIIFTDWNSRLSGRLSHKGKIVNDSVVIDVSSEHLSGKVHKRNIVAKGLVHYENNILDAKNISITSNNSSLTGEASFDFSINSPFPLKFAKWTANIDDLSTFNENMAGKFNSVGIYHGPLEDLELKAKIDAHSIKYKELDFNNLSADIQFLPEKNQASTASLNITDLKYNQQHLESVIVNAKGTQAEHKINLTVTGADKFSTQSMLSGGLMNSEWQGKIQQLDIVHNKAHWESAHSSQLFVTSDSVVVSDTCLTELNNHDKLCVAVNYSYNNMLEGKVAITELSLITLNQYLPSNINIKATSGTLTGNLAYKQFKEKDPNIDASLSSKQGTIETVSVSEKTTTLQYTDLKILASSHDDKFNIEAFTNVTDAGHIKVNIQTPSNVISGDVRSTNIDGLIDVRLDSLNLISLIIPDLEQPKGMWHSKIKISGSIGSPVIQGQSSISISSVFVPRAGIELHNLTLVTQALPNHNLDITGSANSGEGDIAINGSIQDYQSETLLGNLQIKGKNFKIMNIPESQVVISPDLNIVLKQNLVTLTGVMTINQADINIFSPTSRITPSPDVVIVNKETSKSTFPQLAFTGDVRINLEDKIWLRGYGFQGRLKGSLLVHERPNQLTNATGEIAIVEGKYNAYNQDLTIESGNLTFAGNPIDNPNVRIRAVRKTSNEIVAGLTVTGSAQSPNIQLFSEPAMDEAEILAYIILGYPIKQATQKDGSILANAAASIGLASGEKLVKKIANKFGIDEVKLKSSNTTQEASLILGKYLSPQLYLSYAYGIGKAVNTLQLQYQLTDRWMIKTESGQTQSTDILFSIEK